SLPFGSSHLPAERIRGSTVKSVAQSFLQEAATWAAEPEIAAQEGETRILVVDDNPDMRHYVSRLLADRWTVDAVADGAAALAAIETRKPALILTDVMMPGMTGFELLAAIRAN